MIGKQERACVRKGELKGNRRREVRRVLYISPVQVVFTKLLFFQPIKAPKHFFNFFPEKAFDSIYRTWNVKMSA